jgi:uncharacterized phage protein (TIGR02216 family)
MQLGFGVLRLSSQQFWSMTLRELSAALPASLAMERRDLDALMERFPDR